MKKFGALFVVILLTNCLLTQNKLLIPYGKDSFSCVINKVNSEILIIFIAGSGPTDKDGNNVEFKNNSLKILSDSLNKHNISTLRFDKRGVGESFFTGLKEEEMSIDTLVDDVIYIKNFIQLIHKFKKVYILGHSEGSLLGILAINKDTSFSGLISIAGAGIPADSIINLQVSSQSEIVKSKVKDYLNTLKQGKMIPNVDFGYYALFRPSVQPYMISWIKYNPKIEISKINKPVLILQGKSDLQVDTSNAISLRKNAKNSQLHMFDNMNHIMKVVNNQEENIKSYNDTSFNIHPKFAKTIVDFLYEKVEEIEK